MDAAAVILLMVEAVMALLLVYCAVTMVLDIWA